MKKYINRILIITATAAFFTGCTKEVPDVPYEPDPAKADITGYWNGYGYDDFGGKVPLEIIKITKDDNGYYTATKIEGDNAVYSGMITWQGYRTGNPFDVDFTVNNGSDIFKIPVELKVWHQDKLELVGWKHYYIRRTDGYFP